MRKGSDQRKLPKPAVGANEAPVSPPALIALARLLGRLAALAELGTGSHEGSES